MKKILVGFLIALSAVSAVSSAPGSEIREEAFSFGRFGKVALYRGSDTPAHVVLFISGDGGWNLGVVDMARQLASLDAAVLGIDITHFLREIQAGSEGCIYPASDLEALSQYAQKKLGYARYVPPVLVGYSSGATLVYAALVQAPPSTFAGAISLGFCPDLLLSRPMCRGDGLESGPAPKGRETVFAPAKHLNAPWYAFQGLIDQVCDPAATRAYAARIPGAVVVELPKVGHGFSVPSHWMKQFRETFRLVVAPKEEGRPPPAPAVSDLPLVEIPAATPRGDRLAVILSGDGGWASIDRSLGEAFSSAGIPVVGWNSLQYFWTPKTPETGAADLARVLRHYLDAWGRRRVLLIGYSMGAEALPFFFGGLPEELKQVVDGVVLLGPGRRASFEFHLSYWLGGGDAPGSREVLPEIGRIPAEKLLCVYGDEERDSICRELPPSSGRILALKGAHHFGGEYRAIVGGILGAFPENSR